MATLHKSLLSGLCVLYLTNLAAAGEPEAAVKVKWAKGIAADFWMAVRDRQVTHALGLLNPEFREVFAKDEGNLTRDLWPPWTSINYQSEELAPDRNEVVFRGAILGKDVTRECTANFIMRVAREGASGKWSIRFFLITDYKETLSD